MLPPRNVSSRLQVSRSFAQNGQMLETSMCHLGTNGHIITEQSNTQGKVAVWLPPKSIVTDRELLGHMSLQGTSLVRRDH